jgi:hypothetical protein
MTKDIKQLHYELRRVFNDAFLFKDRIRTSFDELYATHEYYRVDRNKTAFKKFKEGEEIAYCIEDHVIEYIETLVAEVLYLFPKKKKALRSLLIELSDTEHPVLLDNLDDNSNEDLKQSLDKIRSYLIERASGLKTGQGKKKGPISFGINHDYIKKLDKIEVIVTLLAKEEVFIREADIENFMELIQLKEIVDSSPEVRLSSSIKDFRHVWENIFQNKILKNSTFKDIESSGKFIKQRGGLLTAQAISKAKNALLTKPVEINEILKEPFKEPDKKVV